MILALMLIRKYLWIIPVSALVIFSMFSSKDLNQRLLATLNTIKLPNQPAPSTLTTPTPTTPLPTLAPPIAGSTTPHLTPVPTIVRHGVPGHYPPVDVDAGVARSGEIRFNVEWPRAITAFSKNPLLGTGPGSITLATDNDYLRSLGESGLLGFITFAFILLLVSYPYYPPRFLKKKLTLLGQNRPNSFCCCYHHVG